MQSLQQAHDITIDQIVDMQYLVDSVAKFMRGE